MRDEPLYTLVFATLVSVVCALAVSGAAVWLRERIAENKQLEREHKVMVVAGLVDPGERLAGDPMRERFAARVATRVVDLGGGTLNEPGDDLVEQLATTQQAPPNRAGLVRVPTHVLAYVVSVEGRPETIVLPVEGKGLWSTIRGYLALDARDLRTVRGVEFYEHGETPGLGGEIDDPRWKAQWSDRVAFDDEGEPVLHVARRRVGSPAHYPHGVDALSGATITSQGVTELMQFWLGPDGFGPMLDRERRAGGVR